MRTLQVSILLLASALPFLEADGIRSEDDDDQFDSIDSVSGSLISEYLSIFDQPIRTRRSLTTPRGGTNRCLSRCAHRYKSQMENSITATGSYDVETKDDSNFVRMCRVAQPFVRCFDQCPEDGDVKQHLRPALEPVRFVCLDRYESLRAIIPCIGSTKPTVAAKCRPRCRRFETAVNKTLELVDNPLVSILYTESEIKDLIGGLCRFVDCSMTCSTPIFRTECGAEAAELTMETVRKVIEAAKVFDRLTSSGRMMPEECDRLLINRSN